MEILRTTKVFYRDKLVFWLLNFSILAILATWGLIGWKQINPDDLAVLHYNIYYGIDILGNSRWLYLIPLFVLILSILDFLAAIFLWTKNRLLSYFLLTTILVINIITLVYLYNIINYNI
ncbi:hypothetical protein HON36_01435 [Candidatus Parcubacteria bacterium]|jgi:hypothetical protein|nr:hypothetical protein [Candidatus Parcubacteria bacterium]MBT7228835.1 hypothetical protein [Candidatus Parcubacteria bacterium]